MTLGRSPQQEDLYSSTRASCEARLPEASIFRLLARDGHALFADEKFADLFTKVGRDSISPRIVAVVMTLQRLHGLSDREAVDAFAFDLRWKYAAGALDFDHPGFVHTVLVDMRERLRRSARPNRILEAVLELAKAAGQAAREAMVDALARDGYGALVVLDNRELTAEVKQAAVLLATVLGQDLESTDNGLFRIARRVAENRIISTVDAEARHGHKTAARGFDGYKGHVSIDPDSEIIVETAVTAGNVGDAQPAPALLSEVLTGEPQDQTSVEIYGDSSYGTANLVEHIEAAGAEVNVKVQSPSPAKRGMFSQDAFQIDSDEQTVRCPAEVLVQLRLQADGSGKAEFGSNCKQCPLRGTCTTSPTGRTVRTHPKYKTLTRFRQQQRDPVWKANYRATRPKVERKIAHMMRRKHGGRRARVRGCLRVGQDFALLAASINLARLAKLGVAAAAA